MIKKLLHCIARWWRITFYGYHDPYFKTEDGVQYGKMPNGMIVRLDTKKDVKRRKRLEDLKEFFK